MEVPSSWTPLVAQMIKNLSACSEGDLGLIPGLGRSPGRGLGNTLQYSYLENSQGQRSLVGCSPWGCKDLERTGRLSTAQGWVQRLGQRGGFVGLSTRLVVLYAECVHSTLLLLPAHFFCWGFWSSCVFCS